MIRGKNENISLQENQIKRQFFTKRSMIPVLFTLIFLVSLLIVVTLVLENTQAA